MKCPVVIEIGSQYLKLVAARPSLKGHQISKVAVRSVASLSDGLLSKTISDLLRELRLTPKPLIVSLPRNLSTVRNLRFPSADPKELEGMVDLHVGRQVPYSKEEIVSGYQTLGVDETGYTRVVLAIVHRDALKKLFNVLDQAKLSPEKVELSSHGVWSWILLSHKELTKDTGLYLLLDIDKDFTDFIIFSRDNMLFSRSITQGAGELAEETKRTKLIGEIKQSLVIFQGEETSKRPSKVFLSGAASTAQGMEDLLRAELGLPVEVVGPFQNIPLSKESARASSAVPSDVSISAVVGSAIDTARRKIAFTLPEVEIRKEVKKRTRQLVILGSLLIYILVAVGGIFLGKMYNRESYLKGLKERFERIEQEANSLAEMSRKIEIVKDRLDLESSALNYLYGIHRLTPPEITLTAISFEEEKRMVLRGEAQAMSDVFKFITALENSIYFRKVETRYTRKRKVKDKEVSEFEIVCPLGR